MAYMKPQYPLKNGDNYIYPITTGDQVILSDGSRLEQNGAVVAGKFKNERSISLTGDVTGTIKFDGSKNVVMNTSVSASKFYTVTLPAAEWSSSAPFTQTAYVDGILASDNPIVDINMASIGTDDNTLLFESWALVGRISTNDGSITAYCYEEKPAVDISINIMAIK